MKILWITNGKFPLLCDALGERRSVAGGWMFSALERLRKIRPDFEFAVATLDRRSELFRKVIDGVTYYLLPEHSRQFYDRRLEAFWRQVSCEFHPDVVHIHGTEQPHGLAYLKACGNENVVSSIQGLVSVIARHYLDGISRRDLFRSFSFGDFLRARLLYLRKLAFAHRGKMEEEHLRRLNWVIGRTSWDRAHSRRLSPKSEYGHVGETLRPEFYTGAWSYKRCVPHTIFMSQAGYPIKGLHFLIRAFPLVQAEFPDVRVFIGGENILEKRGFSVGGYGKLCGKLMRERGIEGRFHFLGALDAEEMKKQYLAANVFVSPSTIENSPNSLCEAQMLGTPVVASDVGGVLDFVEHGKTGFAYRCEESALLAYWICRVFREGRRMDEFVPRMQATARRRHDEDVNARALAEVYERVSGSADLQ